MNKILMILDNAFNPDLRVKKEIDTLNKMGNNVSLHCWDHDSDLPIEENFEQLSIKRIKIKAQKQLGLKKILYLLSFFKQLKSLLKKEKFDYDFIYVHDFLMLPIGVYLKFIYKTKLVYDAHEIYHLMEWEKYPDFISNLIYKFERILINYADHFIVVSQHRKNYYQKKLKRDINVIGNWYDKYNDESKNIRELQNISESKLLFAYYGVINFKVRPVNSLFSAFSNSDNAHLLLGGAGVDKNNASEIANKESNITYLGWLENVREYMDSIDYLVYFMNSSRKYFNYTAPNSLYLAIAHNKPIITNVPGEPKELIDKYKIGFYLENIDDFKIETFNNSDEYKKMVNNIKSIKENYTWSESLNVYNQIFSN